MNHASSYPRYPLFRVESSGDWKLKNGQSDGKVITASKSEPWCRREDERFVPFFEVDTRSRFLITAQVPKLRLEIRGKLLGFGAASNNASDQ